ncbi:hypothetical protein [uncultured Methanospirillum sp.]|nr:hypothetical protein [uncultured Methanospirillum sp.]
MIKFPELMKIMVDADMRAFGLDPIGKSDSIIRWELPDRWWKKD